MSRTTLTHDALVYDSDESFLSAVVPFLRAGLDRGEPLVAVTTPHNIGLIRDALGSDADRATYMDAADWYAKPTSTIAGYNQVLSQLRDEGATRIRGIGEVAFGHSADEQRDWTRYEATLNAVLAHLPAWIVCPYDRRTLPAWVIEHAYETHPFVSEGGTRGTSPRYGDPGELVSRVAPQMPEPSSPPLFASSVLAAEHLSVLRRDLQRVLGSAGAAEHIIDPILVATNEIAANALMHGRGRATVRAWVETPWVQVEVLDVGGAGPDDPFPGFWPPDHSTVGGLGLWIARELCDRVDMTVTPAGFRVTLGMRI